MQRFVKIIKQGRLNLFNRNTGILHVSINVSSIFAGTWLLEKNTMWSFGKLPCGSNIVIFTRFSRNIALMHSLDIALFDIEFCILKRWL